jgi:sarcosine oxidase
MEIFDAAVLGLGALGSATLFQLSRRGARALGVDQFASPHEYGSSHGATRITREAIGEGRHLTPVVRRSHQLWREIEREADVSLFSASGLLILSGAARTSFTHVQNFFANTVAAAREHRVPHELLDAAEIRRRFPQFRLRDDESGYWEPGGGYVRPEACIAAQLDLARKCGAKVHLNERVVAFRAGAKGVTLECEDNVYCASTLIVAAGAWLPELLAPRLNPAFRVFRQVMFWFETPDPSFRSEQFPVFIWELSGRKQPLYGFPDIDGTGVKVATEQFVTATRPGDVDRNVSAAECASMHETYVAPFLPGLGAQCTRASSCLYTVTPDSNFVIDRHPENERVIIASCCSGHGFKHSAALGEALAEIVLDGKSRLDLGAFRRS